MIDWRDEALLIELLPSLIGEGGALAIGRGKPVVVARRSLHDLDLQAMAERVLDGLPLLSSASVRAKLHGEDVSLFDHRVNRFGEPVRTLARDRYDELVSKGGAIFVEDVEFILPELRPFVKSVSGAHATVWTGAFIGFGADGFDAHWDDNCFLALEAAGRKEWYLSQSLRRLPIAGQERYVPHSSPQEQVVMAPGDALFLGRGVIHSTRAVDSPAVHLMVARRPPVLVDILDRALRTLSGAHQALRETFEGLEIDDARRTIEQLIASAEFWSVVRETHAAWPRASKRPADNGPG